jgi:hypothetical protein
MTIKVKQKYFLGTAGEGEKFRELKFQIYTAEIQTFHGLKAQIKIM